MSRAALADLGPWTVDRASGVPLFRQVYRQLRDAVAVGTLKPGDKLPSTRALASHLGVARAVVVTAFEQLLAESVIAGKIGSGTFVASDLPQDLAFGRTVRRSVPVSQLRVPSKLRDGFLENAASHDDRPFTTGRTRFDSRTTAVWRTLSQRAVRALGAIDLGYADPRGSATLRQAISDYLGTARGVRADADQVIVTTGTQQAIDLVPGITIG